MIATGLDNSHFLNRPYLKVQVLPNLIQYSDIKSYKAFPNEGNGNEKMGNGNEEMEMGKGEVEVRPGECL